MHTGLSKYLNARSRSCSARGYEGISKPLFQLPSSHTSLRLLQVRFTHLCTECNSSQSTGMTLQSHPFFLGALSDILLARNFGDILAVSRLSVGLI